MSLLSSEVVHLALYPGYAALARTRGWLRPRVVERGRYEGAPLEALDAALAEPRWRGARLRVVVSNLLVRYAIVSPDATLASAADELAVADARMRQIHGPHAGLDVRISEPLSGRPQVAAGIARDLLEGLRARLARARLRLQTLEPHFVRAMALARPPAGGFWLASVEPGALLLASADRAGWASVAVFPRAGDLAESLAAALREARLLATRAEMPTTLHLHVTGEDAMPEGGAIHLDGVTVRRVLDRGGVVHGA